MPTVSAEYGAASSRMRDAALLDAKFGVENSPANRSSTCQSRNVKPSWQIHRAVSRVLPIIDRTNFIASHLCGAFLFGMCAATLVQVIVRFVLTAFHVNVAVPWSEEIARYLMIWIIFLGAAVACRRAQLISLEFIVRALPVRLGKSLRFVGLILCLMFFFLLIKLGLQFVELGHVETSPVMSVSKVYVYWAMPVGVALMIVNTLALIAETLIHGKDIRLVSGEDAEEAL